MSNVNEGKVIAIMTTDELIRAIRPIHNLARNLCSDGFSQAQICSAFLFASGILMRESGITLEGDTESKTPYPLVMGYMLSADSVMPCPTATAAH